LGGRGAVLAGRGMGRGPRTYNLETITCIPTISTGVSVGWCRSRIREGVEDIIWSRISRAKSASGWRAGGVRRRPGHARDGGRLVFRPFWKPPADAVVATAADAFSSPRGSDPVRLPATVSVSHRGPVFLLLPVA